MIIKKYILSCVCKLILIKLFILKVHISLYIKLILLINQGAVKFTEILKYEINLDTNFILKK